MTRAPSPTASRLDAIRRVIPVPHRPDQARWSEVLVHGAVGAATMFALSAGALTVGARVLARLPLVPRESLRGLLPAAALDQHRPERDLEGLLAGPPPALRAVAREQLAVQGAQIDHAS